MPFFKRFDLAVLGLDDDSVPHSKPTIPSQQSHQSHSFKLYKNN